MDDPNLEEPRLTLPERLQALLEMLFPEPPLVDILTLNSFTFGYRFSGLGPRAVADIERAQRVTRSSGDYSQMGLSEFYAGLIYLHEGQFLGAAQYFAEARRYWTFGGSATAVCLTHLAQGIAQQESYHYEPALSRYGQAERCLRRFPLGDTLGRDATFVAECRALLAECRTELNRRMQTMDVDGDGAAHHISLRPTEAAAPAEEAATVAEGPPAPPPPRDERPPAAPPVVNIRAQPTQPTPVANDEWTEPEISLAPVPGHQATDPHLVWYKVDPADDFDVRAWRSDLSADAYVLVDTRIERYAFQPKDLVVVNSDQAVGQIPVRPTLALRQQFLVPIFLGVVEKPPPNGRDAQTDEGAGSVKLSPDTETPLYAEDIIGIVVGIWAGIALQPRPAR